jgi:hypothetical protein
MEEVKLKYNNFTNFLKEHIKDGSYLALLSTVSVEKFLEKLKEQQNKSPQEITKDLCSKCNLNIQDYPKDVIEKFERYIQYFQKISLHL